MVLAHNRTLLQQYRQISWLALECVVCVLAGVIMGVAATAVDQLYSGVLAPPYTAISPAPLETMLPSLGLFIAMAIGVAGSPASVRIFGEERDVFLRQYSAGASLTAYYLGKSTAVLYGLAIATLHFAAFFVYMAQPTASFDTMFAMSFGISFGVHGLGHLCSMFVSRSNAALLGVIASLIAATLCGYGPNLVVGAESGLIVLQSLSYARWSSEYFMHVETLPYRAQFLVEEISAAAFGYELNRPAVDITMMIVLGLMYRLLAYIALHAVAKLGLGKDSGR